MPIMLTGMVPLLGTLLRVHHVLYGILESILNGVGEAVMEPLMMPTCTPHHPLDPWIQALRPQDAGPSTPPSQESGHDQGQDP